MNRRQLILIGGMAVTLGLVWWVSQEDDAPQAVEAVRHAPVQSVRTSAAPQMIAAKPAEPALADRGLGEDDLFPVLSWRPPPPPPAAALPPPPPVAPPVPFGYVGKWQEGEGMTVFLSQGPKVYSVHLGDVVTQWRLDAIEAGQLTFTYMPMNKQQTMRFAQ